MAITREAVWNAADELDAEGVKPTLNAVRKKLGAGSFTTISDAMTEWKEKQRQKAQPTVEPLPPEVAALVTSIAGELWSAARAAADRALAGERERMETEHDELREQAEEAAQLADALTEEMESLRAQLVTVRADLANRDQALQELHDFKVRAEHDLLHANDEAKRKGEELEASRNSERDALHRAARAEGQVDALKGQLASLTNAIGALKSDKPEKKGKPGS